MFHGGGIFGRAGDGRAESEDFVGESGVDGAGRDGVEVDRLLAEFFGESFDEADDARLGDAVSGEIDAGLGRAAAGEGDDLGAAWGAREQGVEGADGEKRAVKVGADGGAPVDGIGGDGGADFALEAGATDQAVKVWPGSGGGGGGGLNLRPIGDVAAGKKKAPGYWAAKSD